ncbi:glycosyl hydrolase 53 family protein [Lachnotalea sp. AF33-28]|uniref:glycosyl hydrolase 53 family protein n=1 Tax=Lachnotalea sp. AF33-28 TaxID=2292046 RepID=UPI001314ADAB|nr:glycosyl hydrolase 53 family protein [Lachnotalea sp. AF33-28]
METFNKTAVPFRVALGLGQGIDIGLSKGIIYQIGEEKATTMKELQKMYIGAGSTEMYVRIATKRYNDDDTYHARIHNLETSLEYCRVAAALDQPINPEIMCAHTYMDASIQQAPDFRDYPEISKPDKEWSEYSLEEMCSVLEQYGELVAREVLATGCRVEYWNLGNEANYGFAGVNLGLKTAVNPKLCRLDSHIEMERVDMEHVDVYFFKENIWKYNGQMMASLAKGIKKAHPGAKFGSHIAGLFDAPTSVAYFKTLLENGVELSQAGISIYPTMNLAEIYHDYIGIMKKVIRAIVDECGLPVFVAEYGYPSRIMGGFAWNQPVKGYELTAEGQARFTADFIAWLKEYGGSGIRPWAPDLLGWDPGWEPMSLFSYDGQTKIASAKPVIECFK